MSLASRGLRDMDRGPEAIEDPRELEQVRRQARALHLWAAAVTVAVTAISLLIP